MNNGQIRRINFFGGPGSGKSTVMARIFSDLKIAGKNVEIIAEYIKAWAYEKHTPKSFDQLFIFANQTRKEDLVLNNGADLIVTDSPLFLTACYTEMQKMPGWEKIFDLTHIFEEKYPSLNIFIERQETYDTHGRFQDKQEAKDIDELMKRRLREHKIDFICFSCTELDLILAYILKNI